MRRASFARGTPVGGPHRDLVDRLGRPRLCEQKALHLVAAGEPQQHPLLVGLDAFRQHFHAERVAERDDRLDDGAGMAGRAQRADEGAIDLDLAEREFLQVAQARIAGAEIVERDADAERAQRFEPLQGLLRVVDQNPFGHFENDARRRDAAFGNDGGDQIDQLAVADLDRRQVHRHGQVRPAYAIGQRAAQHEFAELGHQAALLGERNEDRRPDGTARRMGPAQQRLDPDHDAAGGGDHGLIMDVEAARGERGFKLAPNEALFGIFRLDIRLEAPHHAAAVALGGAQREIGTAAELVGGAAVVRRLRDADAGADLPVLLHEDRPLQRHPQCLGEHACSLRILAAHDDGEFVVVEAAELGAGRQARVQTFGNAFQQRIAA